MVLDTCFLLWSCSSLCSPCTYAVSCPLLQILPTFRERFLLSYVTCLSTLGAADWFLHSSVLSLNIVLSLERFHCAAGWSYFLLLKILSKSWKTTPSGLFVVFFVNLFMILLTCRSIWISKTCTCSSFLDHFTWCFI